MRGELARLQVVSDFLGDVQRLAGSSVQHDQRPKARRAMGLTPSWAAFYGACVRQRSISTSAL